MKRKAVSLFVAILIGGVLGGRAWAAGAKDKGDAKEGNAAGGEGAAEGGDAPAIDTSGELDLTESKVNEEAANVVKASNTLTWQDIVVIPRKRFLKGGRLELSPFVGTSINDILIQHYVFG